ncbi:MAG: hypothetical protein ACKO8Z_14405, partial [Prosthecobacter sp.]
RFLDAMSNWQDRAMPPIKPLGSELKQLPPSNSERRFGGYRLSKDGIPTFLYQEKGQQIEDTLQPAGDHFERIIQTNGKQTKEVVSW